MSTFSPEIAARALIPKELADRSSGLQLAIHLGAQSILVALAESNGTLAWCEHFAVEDKNEWGLGNALRFLEDRNWHRFNYRQITISYDTPYFTLVPQGFAEEGKEAALLLFQHQGKNLHPHTEHITQANLALIYDLPEAIMALGLQFHGARFYSSASLLLRYTSGQSDRNTAQFFIYAVDGQLILTVFHKGTLKLCNAFAAKGHEDLLYHCANAAMRMGIDLEEVQLKVMGDAASADLLTGYCKYVSNWQAPKGLHLTESSFEESTAYFPVLVHYLCA